MTASVLAPPSASPTVRPLVDGAVTIERRALERTVVAIVREQLGVDASTIRVSLGDDHGGLAISIATPITIQRLGAGGRSAVSSPSAGAASSGTLLDRMHGVRSAVVERMSAVTGRAVSLVELEITAARVQPPERSVR